MKFKLLLDVRDETATIKIVAFDKEAKNLLGQTVDELKQQADQETGAANIKDVFRKISRMVHMFHVKPTFFDFRKGGKSLAASKITPITNTSLGNSKGKNVLIEEHACKTSIDQDNTGKSETPTFKKKRKTK